MTEDRLLVRKDFCELYSGGKDSASGTMRKNIERCPFAWGGKDTMKEIMRFDFGNSTVRADDGFLKMERLYTSCHFMWMTELKNRWRRETEVSPFRDFVFAEKSEFRMALPPANYRLRLYFYDPDEKHEPFSVRLCSVVSDTPLFAGKVYSETRIDIPKGEKVTVDLPLSHETGQVAVDFYGQENG